MDKLRAFVREGKSFVDALYAFFQHFPLPVLLLALGGMVACNLGQSLGITYLFWDENRMIQLIVGLALGLGFAHIVFIGFLLDYGDWLARMSRRDSIREGHWADSALKDGDSKVLFGGLSRPSKLFLWYYYWFFGLTVIVAFVFNRKLVSLVDARLNITTWPLIAGFFITAIGVRLVSQYGHGIAGKLVKRDEDIMHFWAGLEFVLFGIVYAIIFFAREVPASVPIVVLFSLISGIYGFVSYSITTWKMDGKISVLGFTDISLSKVKSMASLLPPTGIIMILVALGLLFIGGSERYKYRFPDLASFYESPQKIESEANSKLPLLEPVDIALTETRRKRPFVIVSTSGGGMTAAAWTVAVLSQLEDAGLDDFPYAIRAITGASGGMVGAAYWNATLQPPGASGYHDVSNEALFDNITADSLTPVVHQLVFNDIWLGMFWPWAMKNDRGQVLEAAWNENTGNRMAHTFEDLYEGEKAGWRPSLIFSPMLVEDGRRLVISNLELGRAINNTAVGSDLPRSVSGLQLRRLFPVEGLAWKLSTAARMNASFPYVSPAASLPTTPKRRVVDAGYYDNYGIDMAANWLMRCWDRATLLEQTRHVILIEIHAFDRSHLTQPGVPGKTNESKGIFRALEDITSPIEGLLSAWEKPQSYRHDELITALRDYLRGPGEQPEIDLTTVRFTNSAKVSVSWILTGQEKESIKEAATNLPELAILQEAWKELE